MATADTAPRKRQRTDEDALGDSCSSLKLVHDEDYYLSDGSCIIQVEDTLFNVHRSILSKDASSFSIMFTLPQGDAGVEGLSDESPVLLRGDTPHEFRNFLWSLYALPHELLLMHTPQADIDKLLDIAKISNKYAFKSLEAWACDAIHDFVTLKPCPISRTTDRQQLTLIIRIAQVCSHDKLLSTMVCIVRQLMLISDEHLSLAMGLADELELDSLTGAAYFEMMQRGAAFWTPARVTREQRLRLLNGFYLLANEWERLRLTAPHFDHSPSCGLTWHQHGCRTSWNDFWRKQTSNEALLSLGLADLGGRLRAVTKELDRWGQANYMHHECRNEVKRIMLAQVKAFEDRMAQYYQPIA